MEVDQELLELAARTVGLRYTVVDAGLNIGTDAAPAVWNPLMDDGDAFRLITKLGLLVDVIANAPEYRTEVLWPNCYVDPGYKIRLAHNGDRDAATRRAIVLAAAEIGKAQNG